MRPALLALALALAGCAAPNQPLLADPGPEEPAPPPPSAPPAAAPPAPPPPDPPAAANDTAEPGGEAWEGTLILTTPVLTNNDGPHELAFAAPVAFNLTVTITGGVSQGDVWAYLQAEPADGCGATDPGSHESVLEAEGPSPLTLAGPLPAGPYCAWVWGAFDSVQVAADYRAEASWTPA